MCKINYVDEHNCFMRYAKNNQLTGRERLLWTALFTIANDRAIYDARNRTYEWPDGFFPVTNGELNLHSTLDKRGIESVRNQLKQRGLIDFKNGNRNSKPPEYKINYISVDIGYKFVPNDAPKCAPNDAPKCAPNDAPKCAPNDAPRSAPFYIDIDKDLDINGDKIILSDGDNQSASAKNALNEFLLWSGADSSTMIDVPDGTRQMAGEIAGQIFRTFGGRAATETDVSYLLAETRVLTGSGWEYLQKDKLQLLAYAFEQAFRKGCPGSWQYVQGCLRNMEQRGIRTIYDIEDYERQCG